MLNINDYFKVNNKYLTRSKIKDFNTCPNYFYRKHILGEVNDEVKQCFINGTVVDSLLAQEFDPTMNLLNSKDNYIIFDGDFRSKEARIFKADKEAEGFIVIKQKDYEEYMAQAIAVEQTDAYKELSNHTKQMLLQCEYDFKDNNNIFIGLAALPDFCKIENRHAIITDLKTVSNFDIDDWEYVCYKHGYFKQFALQTMILKNQGINNFTYRHLVVDKTKNINMVEAIEISHHHIEEEMIVLQNEIDRIANCKSFDKYNPTWSNPSVI